VWAATSGGASRLDPARAARPRGPPPTYLTRAIAGGAEQALPSRGAAQLAEIRCNADESRWIFEWSGVDPAATRMTLFSMRLEGAESEWSEPTDQTSVHYAQLAPGSYRFLVRSVAADGKSFGEPASVALLVLPPLWRKWWFLTLVAGVIAGAGYALHRVRLARALALERLRTQIATDLHDDLGAGLAQVAILSEVAKRAHGAEARGVLDDVGELARTMRSSMSDLVWSVDPRKDTLGDVVRRMRQFANDVLSGDGQVLDFRSPDDPAIERIELAPDRRRNLFLLFARR
jgi:signal transduction histidine kinase